VEEDKDYPQDEEPLDVYPQELEDRQEVYQFRPSLFVVQQDLEIDREKGDAEDLRPGEEPLLGAENSEVEEEGACDGPLAPVAGPEEDGERQEEAERF